MNSLKLTDYYIVYTVLLLLFLAKNPNSLNINQFQIASNISNKTSIIANTTPFISVNNSMEKNNKLKYQDLWFETNESIVLNCTLKVHKDQHVNKKIFHF